jgi:hypothetical protein
MVYGVSCMIYQARYGVSRSACRAV